MVITVIPGPGDHIQAQRFLGLQSLSSRDLEATQATHNPTCWAPSLSSPEALDLSSREEGLRCDQAARWHPCGDISTAGGPGWGTKPLLTPVLLYPCPEPVLAPAGATQERIQLKTLSLPLKALLSRTRGSPGCDNRGYLAVPQ